MNKKYLINSELSIIMAFIFCFAFGFDLFFQITCTNGIDLLMPIFYILGLISILLIKFGSSKLKKFTGIFLLILTFVFLIISVVSLTGLILNWGITKLDTKTHVILFAIVTLLQFILSLISLILNFKR